jgi:hypothetical protein
VSKCGDHGGTWAWAFGDKRKLAKSPVVSTDTLLNFDEELCALNCPADIVLTVSLQQGRKIRVSTQPKSRFPWVELTIGNIAGDFRLSFLRMAVPGPSIHLHIS